MSVTAEYLVVDSGGFIKNDLGTLDAMTDNIVTLHEVILASDWSKQITFVSDWHRHPTREGEPQGSSYKEP